MTMITPSYLGETIEYSSLHACRSTLEDPTRKQPRNTCVRHDSWKAILWQDGKTQLYNLNEDPDELHNLAKRKDSGMILKKLRRMHNDYVDQLVLHPNYLDFGKV